MKNCSEMIVNEDIYDYIVSNLPGIINMLNNNPEVCFEQIDDKWIVAHSTFPSERQFNISDIGYYTIPKIYGLMRLEGDLSVGSNVYVDSSSMDAVNATKIINQPYLNARGQGVMIGVIDTGIDYTRDNFRDSAGNTRIMAIWDQTGEYSDNAFVQYGALYESEQINEALRAYDDGENPYNYVDSRDESGHGTFMAGIAASSEKRNYTGVAPDSSIVCVKLKGAKKYLRDFFYIKDEAVCFEESDIMTAAKFLRDYADSKNMPLVIYLGLGSASGSRTGDSPLSDVLDSLTMRDNTCVVVAAGNEAVARTHFSGYANVAPEYKEMEINVDKRGKGFIMEIWAKSLDVLSVSIVSPTGQVIPRIPARIGMSNQFSFLLENSKIYIDYQITERVSGQEVIFIRFETPAEGIWKIQVYSLTNLPGYFNAWMNLLELMDSTAYFLNSDADTTLVEPACARRVITIGAYNHNTNSSDVNSSRGYTADSRIKPDIVAPGVNVYGVGGVRGYTSKSGTSVAAAHMAGAAALFLSWGVTENNRSVIGNSEIKSYIIRGAERIGDVDYPNVMSGYGRLDIAGAFDQMRIS